MALPTTVIFDDPVNKGQFIAGLKEMLNTQRIDPLGHNPIINGCFEVAQRGTSFADPADNAHTIDCWATDDAGGTNSTFAQQNNLAILINGGYSDFGLRAQRNNGSSNTGVRRVSQVLETRESMAIRGQDLVLQFAARAGANYSAAGGALVSRIAYGTGTNQSMSSFHAGTWTGQTNFDQTNNLGALYQEFTHTVTIPLTATQIAVSFRFTPLGTAGANDWFEVTLVRMNRRGNPGTFLIREFNEELMRCQRRYCKTLPYATAPANGAAIAGAMIGKAPAAGNAEPAGTWRFPVSMRAAPTITLYNPLGGTAGQWRNAANSASSANASTEATSADSVTIRNGGTQLTAANDYYIHADASADF